LLAAGIPTRRVTAARITAWRVATARRIDLSGSEARSEEQEGTKPHAGTIHHDKR
jgi:hypothetical protein